MDEEVEDAEVEDEEMENMGMEEDMHITNEVQLAPGLQRGKLYPLP